LDQLSQSARERKKKPATQLTDIDTIYRSGTSMLADSKGLILIHLKYGKKKWPIIHLTGIDKIDRSGTLMRTNIKGLNPIYLKKGKETETCHPPDRH
jgi:hypothetical protein